MKRWLFVAIFLLFAAPSFANVTCDYCVSSVLEDGTPAGTCTGTPWDDPYATVMQTWAAGDIVCVADDHDESTAASLTITGPNPSGAPDPASIICVDVSTCTAGSCEVCDQPSERASVEASTTANSIYFVGTLFTYGIDFETGSSFYVGFTAGTEITIEESILTFDTASARALNVGLSNNVGHSVTLNNVDVVFGSVGQSIIPVAVRFLWDGGSTNTNVTRLIKATSSRLGTAIIRNVDLSQQSGNVVIGSEFATTMQIELMRCKFNASVALVSGSIDVPGARVIAYQCQSGSVVDPPYQMEEHSYQGTVSVSTANVRTGGASDGTTSYAWKFDTTTGSNVLGLYEPLCSSIPISRWVTGGSEITATVYANSGAAMQDDDFWPIWSLPPVGATSLGIRVSDRADPGDPQNITSDGVSSWTTGTAYKFSQTFTPAEDGQIIVWPCVATATAVYFDVKIDIE